MWFPADATKMQLPQGPAQNPITPNLIVLHTNGGNGSVQGLWNYWNSIQSGVFSHFQVDADGKAGQYQSTDLEAPAEWDANSRAISIETQDNNDPSVPWTAPQIASILNIIRACSTYHGIPLRLAQSDSDSGIGWHQMFPAWNQSGHNCPGPVRVQQIKNVIIPALTTEVSELTPQDWKDMGALADKIIVHTRNDMFAMVKAINAKVGTLIEEVDALHAELDAIKSKGGYGA